ncbi:unnamed protein product [Bemisia tabaci]|uniref:39S ribosomal protein L41, mitochondrial n=1 Tax=Bemisia tabaci TaxID=7038 RepID=A0A9P0F263_BEMTA|nr:unnamed protein product [Bemisia tabaci]
MEKLLTVCLRPQIQLNRSISHSSVLHSKKNFRKFVLPHRGSEAFRKRQEENPHPDIWPFRFGVKKDYVVVGPNKKRVQIPELQAEIIVPDLTGFKLKPYVSYATIEVIQSEFTPKDLFNAVYRRKIVNDFQDKKLDETGNPLEPSPAEQLTADQAKKFARMTGSDLFEERWRDKKKEQQQ